MYKLALQTVNSYKGMAIELLVSDNQNFKNMG